MVKGSFIFSFIAFFLLYLCSISLCSYFSPVLKIGADSHSPGDWDENRVKRLPLPQAQLSNSHNLKSLCICRLITRYYHNNYSTGIPMEFG
jgi:hypothetical protein